MATGRGRARRRRAVADAVASVLGQPWTDRHGDSRAIGVEDVIVVAPYNAHVALVHGEIERRLAPGLQVRVGTVDKFQGQEGAIAIYSMASSSRDDAPRDMDFLYSRNRLNVAVSRARAIALVIASPRLLEANCRTPEQMRLVNALCRLVEEARSGPTASGEHVVNGSAATTPEVAGMSGTNEPSVPFERLTLGLE